MIKTRISFSGGNELARALATLSQRVNRQVRYEALERAAEPMRRTASRLAPHAPGKPDLRDAIEIQRVKGEHGEPAVAVGPTRDAFYGFYQEFGTVHHGAQPFMRPAFDTEASRALAELGRAMWTALAARGVSRSGSTASALQGVV